MEAWQEAPAVNAWEGAPVVEEEGMEVVPSMQGPRQDVPAWQRELESPSQRQQREEQFQQVQTEAPKWAADNFARLQEFLPFVGGGEEGMKTTIEKAFGDRAELVFHEGLQDYAVKFDTGETVPFDPAKFDIADIRGMRAGAGQLASEVAAGGAGFAAGGPWGAAIAAPLGAGAAEHRILTMGQEFSGLSDSEINIRAAQETLLAYAGEALFGAGGMIYRRILKSPQAKRFLVSITDDEIDEAIKRFETTQAKVSERAGVEMEATTGQQLIEAAPDTGRKVQAFERGLEEAGEEVGQVARLTQVEAEESLTKRLFGPAGDASELGEAVQKVAAAEVGREAENIAEGSVAEQTEAMARREIDVGATYVSAEEARVAVRESRDRIFDELSERYKDFWQRVPAETKANLGPLRKVAKTWEARIARDIAPMMTEESGKLMKQVASSKETSLDSVSRFVTTLKAEMRSMDTVSGQAKTREKKPLLDLLSELEKARGEALEGVSKDMRKELNDIDRSYRIAKETLDLGLVNRLITRSKNGGFRIADTKFFKTVLNSPSESKNVAALLASPEFASTNGLEVAKRGIMGLYRDEVIEGGKLHAKFMTPAIKDSLRQFFSPEEMKRFSSREKAEATIKIADKREKALIKELKDSFEYKMGKYDPEDVLDRTAGHITKTRKLKELLKNHPDKWEGYQGLRSGKLLKDVQSFDDVGNRFVDHNKLDKILASDKAELTEVFGKQYVDDLNLLKDISKLRKVPKALRSPLMDALKQTDSGPLMMTARATVARPLSRAGLLTTAGSKLYKGAAREATAKLMQNPKVLRDAMKLYNRGAPWKQWRRFWINIGAIEFVRAMEENNPELKESLK